MILDFKESKYNLLSGAEIFHATSGFRSGHTSTQIYNTSTDLTAQNALVVKGFLPRTGSTYFHSLLALDEEHIQTYKQWELRAPVASRAARRSPETKDFRQKKFGIFNFSSCASTLDVDANNAGKEAANLGNESFKKVGSKGSNELISMVDACMVKNKTCEVNVVPPTNNMDRWFTKNRFDLFSFLIGIGLRAHSNL